MVPFLQQFVCRGNKTKINKLFPLPEVPLADSLLLDVPQRFDPEPNDSEVAEQASAWRRSAIMPLDEEVKSLLLPLLRELACKNKH